MLNTNEGSSGGNNPPPSLDNEYALEASGNDDNNGGGWNSPNGKNDEKGFTEYVTDYLPSKEVILSHYLMKFPYNTIWMSSVIIIGYILMRIIQKR